MPLNLLTPASSMVRMQDWESTKETDARPASLGDFIATQRRAAELSLRQLAERAGISNPYVSQIERGLRRPSAEVLQSLATALQVSAGTLYSYAGIDPTDEARPTSVQGAIRNDPRLTDAQKHALLDVYAAFLAAPGPIQGGNPEPTHAG
ncbi:Transcriptional regulator, contains XRE-family HTH domain [Propioniciclava tarda]|nr:Transcriptional regulator, contains XRE-family HTH domain [Propioniciclava tarda]